MRCVAPGCPCRNLKLADYSICGYCGHAASSHLSNGMGAREPPPKVEYSVVEESSSSINYDLLNNLGSSLQTPSAVVSNEGNNSRGLRTPPTPPPRLSSPGSSGSIGRIQEHPQQVGLPAVPPPRPSRSPQRSPRQSGMDSYEERPSEYPAFPPVHEPVQAREPAPQVSGIATYAKISGFFGSSRRYLALDEKGELVVREGPFASKSKTSVFITSECQIEPEKSLKVSISFTQSKAKPFRFEVESPDDRKRWIDALKLAAATFSYTERQILEDLADNGYRVLKIGDVSELNPQTFNLDEVKERVHSDISSHVLRLPPNSPRLPSVSSMRQLDAPVAPMGARGEDGSAFGSGILVIGIQKVVRGTDLPVDFRKEKGERPGVLLRFSLRTKENNYFGAERQIISAMPLVADGSPLGEAIFLPVDDLLRTPILHVSFEYVVLLPEKRDKRPMKTKGKPVPIGSFAVQLPLVLPPPGTFGLSYLPCDSYGFHFDLRAQFFPRLANQIAVKSSANASGMSSIETHGLCAMVDGGQREYVAGQPFTLCLYVFAPFPLPNEVFLEVQAEASSVLHAEKTVHWTTSRTVTSNGHRRTETHHHYRHDHFGQFDKFWMGDTFPVCIPRSEQAQILVYQLEQAGGLPPTVPSGGCYLKPTTNLVDMALGNAFQNFHVEVRNPPLLSAMLAKKEKSESSFFYTGLSKKDKAGLKPVTVSPLIFLSRQDGGLIPYSSADHGYLGAGAELHSSIEGAQMFVTLLNGTRHDPNGCIHLLVRIENNTEHKKLRDVRLVKIKTFVESRVILSPALPFVGSTGDRGGPATMPSMNLSDSAYSCGMWEVRAKECQVDPLQAAVLHASLRLSQCKYLSPSFGRLVPGLEMEHRIRIAVSTNKILSNKKLEMTIPLQVTASPPYLE